MPDSIVTGYTKLRKIAREYYGESAEMGGNCKNRSMRRAEMACVERPIRTMSRDTGWSTPPGSAALRGIDGRNVRPCLPSAMRSGRGLKVPMLDRSGERGLADYACATSSTEVVGFASGNRRFSPPSSVRIVPAWVSCWRNVKHNNENCIMLQDLQMGAIQ